MARRHLLDEADVARDVRVGQIALHNQLIDAAQLEECLRIQRDLRGRGYRLRIGEVLIEKAYLDRRTLAAILKAQGQSLGLAEEHVDTTISIHKFTPREADLLVARAQRDGPIEPARIDECFEIQSALEDHGIDCHLLEILLTREYLRPEMAADILTRHEAVRRTLRVVRDEVDGDGELDEIWADAEDDPAWAETVALRELALEESA